MKQVALGDRLVETEDVFINNLLVQELVFIKLLHLITKRVSLNEKIAPLSDQLFIFLDGALNIQL